jgi:hypothetical protein
MIDLEVGEEDLSVKKLLSFERQEKEVVDEEKMGALKGGVNLLRTNKNGLGMLDGLKR